MEQTQGYGAAPSSSGVTTLSTSQGGMPGYMPPPSGISVWNMPPLEDASHQPTVPGCHATGVSHHPAIPTSHWGGWMAKGRDEHEGYCATGSSDAYTPPSATSTPSE